MENNKFKSIYTSDISYENYTISNIFVTFNDELDEKPVIDPSEYTQYDTIIENLLNFNWKIRINNILFIRNLIRRKLKHPLLTRLISINWS